jgi:hypothetical protein
MPQYDTPYLGGGAGMSVLVLRQIRQRQYMSPVLARIIPVRVCGIDESQG